MSNSLNTYIRTAKNGDLRKYLKEIKKISISKTPASVKQTKEMKRLFYICKEDNPTSFWMDMLTQVKVLIESEILYRITIDEF